VPYQVLHVVSEGTEVCTIIMGDKEAKTVVFIETNASDRTFVATTNFADPPPASYARLGAKQSLRLEVDEVAQSYSIENFGPKKAGKASASGFVPRAALRHLQSAVNSRSGFTVKVGDGEPFRLSVPPRAADAFQECGRSILRGRLDGALDRMNRRPE
jgi:hypothetical protein